MGTRDERACTQRKCKSRDLVVGTVADVQQDVCICVVIDGCQPVAKMYVSTGGYRAAALYMYTLYSSDMSLIIDTTHSS